MVDGMLAEIGLQGRPHLPGRELADTDRYCYFVAGTVGELLTEIFAFEGALREEASSAHFAESVDFGKALQLVNIAKDFHGDLREGRCFWPGLGAFPAGETPPFAVLERSFRQLEERFRTYRQKAWDYMRRIDKEARPDVYRFCVFPLRMAEETMDLGGRDLGWLAAGGTFKVSRLKTLALAAEAGLTL
jgi:farnesyl-diphosphate farnesyltransferase